MQKVLQYEGMGDELTKTILNKLKGVQQVITDDDIQDTKTVVSSFSFAITNR
jgi:hypothetical protein